ncbi:MAG: hypothetical protein A2583_14260 [Bdellovibrionales bacterium RIFOXYD1_FULL_53_11]|nr:MAG: hypothetical protein A2583_14260 [Bdellovibrionales bacterium RIFOXYD1_FULL_53_11]
MVKRALYFSRKIIAFLGPQITLIIIFGIMTGLMLFFVELALAFSLQAFLLVLGIANSSSMVLPAWLSPQLDLKNTLAAVFILGVLRAALTVFQSFLQQSTNERFVYLLRKRVVKWAFNSESVSASQALSLFGDYSVSAAGAVVNLQLIILQTTFSLFLVISLMKIAPDVTLLVLGVVALFVYPFKRLAKWITRRGSLSAEEFRKTNNWLIVSIKNLLLLKIYGLIETEEQKTQQGLDRRFVHAYGYCKVSGLATAFPQFMGVVMVCTLSLAWGSKSLPAGILLTYLYLITRFLTSVGSIAGTYNSLSFSYSFLGYVASWWMNNSPDSIKYANRTPVAVKEEITINDPLGWNIDSITFKYPSLDLPVLDKFSLKIQSGSATVIVGQSGAGKSTLLGLLIGEHLPQSGMMNVIINGKPADIQDTRYSFLHYIGYVGAESFLIDGTIRENLLYGLKKEPSKDEISDALSMSECKFIESLPQGLEHRITDQGQGLSAGQKQRISLARALLRKPRALILDEATANLDEDTESRLVDTLIRLKGKMTVIAVTHRSGMHRMADNIVRMLK